MDRQVRPLRSACAVLGLVIALVAALTLVPTATATAQAGSCAGFTNRIGMTNKVIRIGNASDISGPVPDLYRSARLATRAYVAYFNSKRTICGRKLALDAYDAKTDVGANRTAYRTMCTKDFAAIGSMSAFDAGGSADAQACRLPDIRAAASTQQRNTCTTCFGINATRAGEAPNSVPDHFVATNPAASQKAAMLYLNAGPYPARASTLQKAASQRGFTFVYNQAIDVADFNYGPYVQHLQGMGVKLVQFVGEYQQTARLAQAMNTHGFHPDVFLVDPGSYTPAYATSGGAAVNGSIVPINFLPLNANQTELNLYRTWLKKIAPSAVPTAAGLFAWSAAKLFTQQAIILGAKLTRASLNARLRTVTAWTGGGLHAPMQVGTKHVSPCARLLVLQSGTWASVGGANYRCSGVTKVS